MDQPSGCNFENKKFCQFKTLMFRWDCSDDLIRNLVSKGKLKLWHPEGRDNVKGGRLDVASVLEVERNGYLD